MNSSIAIDEQTYFDGVSGTFFFLPEIINYSVDKDILTDLGPATVTWEVKDATNVTINNEIVANSGHKSFFTTDVLDIVLIAVNQVRVPVKRTLTISAKRIAPIIEFFNADSNFVIKGMAVKLSWNVIGASRIEIDNSIGAVTGKKEIAALIGTTGVFNLTAFNHFGDKAFATISVSVFPIPIIEGVFCGTPLFSIKPINIQKLCFTSFVNVSGNVSNYKPKVIRLVEFEKNILQNRLPVNFVLFQGNKFVFSMANHKNIISIIKLLWKKIFKERIVQNSQQS